jgi:hypothetical protein
MMNIEQINELIEKWLADNSSVTVGELETAYWAADAAADAADAAGWAAANSPAAASAAADWAAADTAAEILLRILP